MQIVKTPFSSWGVAYSTDDDGDMDSIETTQQFTANILPPSVQGTVVATLKHGSRRVEVTSADKEKRVEVDALLTNDPACALSVRVADCIPMVVFDEKHHALALIHGGWRSMLQNIVPLTIQEMRIRYGSDPSLLQIWIGPSLRKCCYSLEHTRIHQEFSEWKQYLIQQDGKQLLDLVGAAVDQLVGTGVQKDHIIDSGLCTYHDEGVYSLWKWKDQGKDIRAYPHFAVVTWMKI